jgi:GT2 family glycosyltransferase
MNAPNQAVARNAACPCGSGRRFKACCGNRAGSVVSAPGERLADRLQRALALQQGGDLVQAEAAYREILEHGPDLADAVHMLGVIHLQAGNHAEALRRLHQAAELFHWEFPTVRYNLGLAISALLSGRNRTQVERLWRAYDGWRDDLRAERRDIAPCVSIVVAGFDHAAAIEAALQSAFRQSYPRIELIVVDDGAVERLRPMLARSPHRWRIHARQKGGVASAINDAIAQSSGEYVSVLVGADRLAPTRVETMVDAVARTGAAWGFSRGTLVGSDGVELTAKAALPTFDLAYCADDIAASDTVGVSLLSRNPVISASALFFSRAVFDELGGFREHPPCYDWDFCLRASIIAEPVYVPSAEYGHSLPSGSGSPQAEEAARLASRTTFAVFYDAALATHQAENPFAPVPAVWGERFFAQVLARGHATSLPASVLRDLLVRAAAAAGVALR